MWQEEVAPSVDEPHLQYAFNSAWVEKMSFWGSRKKSVFIHHENCTTNHWALERTIDNNEEKVKDGCLNATEEEDLIFQAEKEDLWLQEMTEKYIFLVPNICWVSICSYTIQAPFCGVWTNRYSNRSPASSHLSNLVMVLLIKQETLIDNEGN